MSKRAASSEDDWKKDFAFAVCLFAMAFYSCMSQPSHKTDRENRYANRQLKQVRHANGLTLNVAESLPITETSSGFLIIPSETRDRRYSIQATVNLRPGVARPEGEWAKERRVEERVIHYRVDEGEAGGASGDEIEYTLKAWEEYRGGHISYEQVLPDSLYEHGFDLCWHIIDGASVQSRS